MDCYNSCSISNWIAALLITFISRLALSILSLYLYYTLINIILCAHYVKSRVQRPLLRRLAIMRLRQRRKIVTYSNYANEWNEVLSRFFPIHEPRPYKLRATRELIIRIINLHRACYRYKFAAKFRGGISRRCNIP